jgi:MinD-like ATPase involved in chromosome partitioning or flagellar assembly
VSTTEEEGVAFAPHSPWSRPPIYRPTPPPSIPPDDPEQAPPANVPPSTVQGHDPAHWPSPPPHQLPPPPHWPPPPPHRPPPPEAQDDEFDEHFDEHFDDHEVEADGSRPTARHARAGIHPYPDIELPLTYAVPTAAEFATRRAVRPREWVATTGVRAAARRSTFGLVRLRPNRREREGRVNLSAVRRAFGGLRQITVVNPKGGAGKTVATLMLGLTFGQTRGGFVLAWDNNETQGTLGMRAQPDAHARTVRDLLRDLDRFAGGNGRIGELAAYVRAQADAMFDVLASDEAATAGEMLTARAYRDIREVVGRFYKLILVDTGNNVRAENWQAAVDATDQLLITMSARNDSAETAARLLDHLEQTGRRELVRRAVTVVTMPPHRKELNPGAIERHFNQRCRTVLRVPYDRHLDSGAPVRYSAVSPESRRAWLRVAAALADGL